MTESTTTETVVSRRISTEGAEIATILGKREIKAQRDFSKDIAVGDCKANNGFDVRLGELMVELRSGLTEDQRISSKLIKAAGIASIPSQRRSEALRLVTQREAIDTFLKESGSKFTSLTAMFAAMDKQAKLDVADDTDSEADSEDDSEAEAGQELTLDMIVNNFVNTVKREGFSMEEALDTVIAQLSGDKDAQSAA